MTEFAKVPPDFVQVPRSCLDNSLLPLDHFSKAITPLGFKS